MPSSVCDRLHRAPHIPAATTVGVVAVILSLSTSLTLLFLHRVLSGSGDQLDYYHQAERLIPFTNHHYGPSYFAAIRLVHDVTGVDWFVAAKILSWLSACLFLLCAATLARKLLGRDPGMLVLALVALNPTVIEQSYYELPIIFGSALCLAAITATTLAETARPLAWFPCGLLFGIACLTRFQNNSLFLGAILGTLIMPRVGVTRRITRAACLAAGGFLPIIGWNIFLRLVQGSPPPRPRGPQFRAPDDRAGRLHQLPQGPDDHREVWQHVGCFDVPLDGADPHRGLRREGDVEIPRWVAPHRHRIAGVAALLHSLRSWESSPSPSAHSIRAGGGDHVPPDQPADLGTAFPDSRKTIGGAGNHRPWWVRYRNLVEEQLAIPLLDVFRSRSRARNCKVRSIRYDDSLPGVTNTRASTRVASLSTREMGQVFSEQGGVLELTFLRSTKRAKRR